MPHIAVPFNRSCLASLSWVATFHVAMKSGAADLLQQLPCNRMGHVRSLKNLQQGFQGCQHISPLLAQLPGACKLRSQCRVIAATAASLV